MPILFLEENAERQSEEVARVHLKPYTVKLRTFMLYYLFIAVNTDKCRDFMLSCGRTGAAAARRPAVKAHLE